MSSEKSEKKLSARERYFSGEITAIEYLEKLNNNREGDQFRRSIEQKLIKISSRLNKLMEQIETLV